MSSSALLGSPCRRADNWAKHNWIGGNFGSSVSIWTAGHSMTHVSPNLLLVGPIRIPWQSLNMVLTEHSAKIPPLDSRTVEVARVWSGHMFQE